jgi:hypothetical protein
MNIVGIFARSYIDALNIAFLPRARAAQNPDRQAHRLPANLNGRPAAPATIESDLPRAA